MCVASIWIRPSRARYRAISKSLLAGPANTTTTTSMLFCIVSSLVETGSCWARPFFYHLSDACGPWLRSASWSLCIAHSLHQAIRTTSLDDIRRSHAASTHSTQVCPGRVYSQRLQASKRASRLSASICRSMSFPASLVRVITTCV